MFQDLLELLVLGQLGDCNLAEPLFHLHCSFESNYGVQRQRLPPDQQEALELHEFERMRLDQLKSCGSPEEREQRKLTDKELQELLKEI